MVAMAGGIAGGAAVSGQGYGRTCPMCGKTIKKETRLPEGKYGLVTILGSIYRVQPNGTQEKKQTRKPKPERKQKKLPRKQKGN